LLGCPQLLLDYGAVCLLTVSFAILNMHGLIEKKESKEMNIKKIVEKVDKFGVGKLIVITGGEPFMQKDIYSLSKKLVKNGYIVQIETSGKAKIDMYAFDNIKTFVVMSPKQYKQNNGKFLIHRGNVKQLKNRAGDFKFVVENEKELKMVLLFVNEFRIPNEKIWLMAKRRNQRKTITINALNYNPKKCNF